MLQYWRFYWPLALTGVAMVLGVQFQNAALARYPEAVTELAVFALGYSTFGFFRASLNFIAQLTNVFARSAPAMQRCQRFVLLASVVIVSPLLVLGHTEAGAALLAALYRTDGELTARVQEYLVYLAPIIVLGGQRFFYTGLLVQARLTGWVTVVNLLFLAVEIGGLVAGFTLGLRPVAVLVGAETLALCCQLAASSWVKRRYYALPAVPEHEGVTHRELVAFFVPVSMTGVMFALSRPVLYAFVSRAPDGLVAIAAMRVAFDFSMIFQQAANQFRHFFVTFGLDDLARKRRFMTGVGAAITATMLLFALTPLLDRIWADWMKIPEELRAPSLQVFLVMCLLPVVITARNFFHGRLMVERRTTGMAVGSALRVAGIAVAARAGASAGWLDHVTASFILILGFAIETATVALAALRPRAGGASTALPGDDSPR